MDVVLELNFVGISNENAALTVGFADDEVETTRYFMFQRSLDPQDDDGVYVERDGQEHSAYGSVLSCSLERDRISVVLDPSLAAAIDMPASFAIGFRCGDGVFRTLRAELPRIFAGTACTVSV